MHEYILKEVYHLKLLPIPGQPKGVYTVMGSDGNVWCVCHRIRGHCTKNCHQLKKEIEALIQKSQLSSYVKDVGVHSRKISPPREDVNSDNPMQKKGRSVNKVHITHHTLNTIVEGFAGGGETNSTRKRYARTMMHVRKEPSSEERYNQTIITLSKKNAEGVLPHKDDLMVIIMQIRKWNVKRVLIEQGSSANVLYWDAFKGMNFDIIELFLFKGSLVGLSGEPKQVLGHFPMMTTFGKEESAKSILVKKLIINDVSPYNAIISKPSFNALEAVLTTMYLILKYPMKDGRVGIIKGDQEIARKYHKYSLKIKKRSHTDESVKDDQVKVNLVYIDLREDPVDDSLTPIEDLNAIHIDAQSSQITDQL